MTESPIQRALHNPRVVVMIRRGLLVSVGIALLLQLRLLFITNINWDEFHYLSWVYVHLRGDLDYALQTVHVHFFTWLRDVPANEVDQIVAARLVVFCFRLATVYLLYRIGRVFLDSSAALFAVFCYLSFSFVLEHGVSFRTDPFATFFCLVAVYSLLRPPWWLARPIAGLALAAALVVTIKSTLYLPLIGLMLLLPLLKAERRGEALAAGVAFGLALGIGYAAFYHLHSSTLATADLQQVGGFISEAAGKVLDLDRLFPGRFYIFHSLMENAVIWLCLGFGAGILFRDHLRGRQGRQDETTYLLLYLMPLAVFSFYRNTFPYVYAFILPLPILACGVLFARLMRAQPGALLRTPRILALGLCLAVAANLGGHFLSNVEPGTDEQRATIDLVHRLFPEPVTYIDRCEMISSHRKVGLFMSTWGMESYLDAGRPVFRELLTTSRPRYLIANIASLNPLIDQEQLRSLGHYVLLEEDQAVLRDNFVHHWGSLFVAGKRLGFAESRARVVFEVLIPGRYTLEAKVPIEIDGTLHEPSDTLELSTGRHVARRLNGGRGQAILRWGEHLYRPSDPAPPSPLFTGF